MKRPKQIFEAPDGARSVDVFAEHWEVILTFAQTVDAALADAAAACAYSSDAHDVVRVGRDELESVVAFLSNVRTALQSVPPVEPEPTDDLPENFSNEELGRILGAVIGVMRQSLALEQPFRAWRE